MKKLSIKKQLLLFLWVFLLGISIFEHDYTTLWHALLVTVTAVAVESLCLFIKERKWQVSESSFITGIILGFLLGNDLLLWQYGVSAAVAILSKHLIRFKKKHIFNPAAFGALVVLVLGRYLQWEGVYLQWKGAYLFYILIPVGCYIAWKIKKVKLVSSFLVSFTIAFFISSLFTDTHFKDIMLSLNCFFVFIMMTEPKTSPISSKDQLLVGGLSGVGVNVLYPLYLPYDPELVVLIVGNIVIACLKNGLWKISKPVTK